MNVPILEPRDILPGGTVVETTVNASDAISYRVGFKSSFSSFLDDSFFVVFCFLLAGWSLLVGLTLEEGKAPM